MPKFTVRVELHGADERDYETLYEHMAAKGFTKTITGDDGRTWDLPPAEYNLVKALKQTEVRDLAAAAAKATGRRAGVLVTEGTRCWIGLDETSA
ncbi:type V toxin-antitoxin system endoribonuclease antitoxin GhoS [Pseudomonas pudica]|uniref:type V toxin-antitoxin system endoribonuclease antitoxin GhoS n=1 Tax=Pseudomonas pudica TaxID=272772 RepID=UPI00320B937C